MIEIILAPFFLCMAALYFSWIIILTYPKREEGYSGETPTLSIIIPAYNEQESIDSTVKAAYDAEYSNKKEIIVVDDGSTDKTPEILAKLKKEYGITVLNAGHQGKANAINEAAKKARNEVVLALDADSRLEKDALEKIVAPFADKNTAAVSGVIRAAESRNPLVWFQDFEYILSSAWRHICNKIGGTYMMPGFAAFRKDALEKIGGFQTDTLSEDFDVGVRLKKAGYRLNMSDAIIFTHVPQDIKSLARQRIRWGKGTLQVIKKHSDVVLNRKFGPAGLYGIPTQMYWVVYGFFSIPLTVYQIAAGYLDYFAAYKNYASFEVFTYFFGWLTSYGMLDYMWKTFAGEYMMTAFFVLNASAFCLNMVYITLALLKIARPQLKHLFAIFFFLPYSLFILSMYVYPALEELLRTRKGNINFWEK